MARMRLRPPRRHIAPLLAVTGLVLASAAPSWAADPLGPVAIAQNGQGTSYVGYPGGGPIARYNADGKPLTAWGVSGSAVGQIGDVVALAVDPGDHVWVLDDNLRLQEFSGSGTYMKGATLPSCSVGISPDAENRGGLEVTGKWIFVAHPCANELLAYSATAGCAPCNPATIDLDTALRGISFGPGPGTSTSQLYVAEPLAGELQTFAVASTGQFTLRKTVDVTAHGSDEPAAPVDLFVDGGGQVMLADTQNDQILFLDSGNAFTEYRHLGGTGTARGKLDMPLALDVHSQDGTDLAGDLWIADNGNERIQRWSSYGNVRWMADAIGGPVGPPPPPPANSVAPSITGQPVEGTTLVCSPGAWSNSPTYSYAWLRDGATAAGTGASYVAQAADIGHSLSCRVTAANAGGSAMATSGPVAVTSRGDGTVGVTIDGGATYAPSLAASLTIHDPPHSTGILVSNDPAFPSPQPLAIRGDDTYAWTLEPPATEGGATAVYVRFTGPGADPLATYTDDVLLDVVPPQVSSAVAHRLAGDLWKIKIAASDGASGLAKLRVAKVPGRKVRSMKFTRSFATRNIKASRYVQVIDGAGNAGDWVFVRLGR